MNTTRRIMGAVVLALQIGVFGACTVTDDGTVQQAPAAQPETDPTEVNDPFPEARRTPLPGEGPNPAPDFPEGVNPPP